MLCSGTSILATGVLFNAILLRLAGFKTAAAHLIPVVFLRHLQVDRDNFSLSLSVQLRIIACPRLILHGVSDNIISQSCISYSCLSLRSESLPQPFSTTMSKTRPLQGSCNCGRNHYSVNVPREAIEQAQVYFDDSSESSKIRASQHPVQETLSNAQFRKKSSHSTHSMASCALDLVLLSYNIIFP